MLVEEHEDARGIWNLSLLEELDIKGIEPIRVFTWVAYLCVHGHRANALAIRGELAIGRALVNLRGAVRVRPKLRLSEINEVCVVVAIHPVLHVVGPGLAPGQGFGNTMIIDDQLAVV